MLEQAKTILTAVESAPELTLRTTRLQQEIAEGIKAIPHGEPIPEDLTDKYRRLSVDSAALNRLARLFQAIQDQEIRLLLMARAMLDMPWALMRSSDGADARDACAAYLDAHTAEYRAIFPDEGEEG